MVLSLNLGGLDYSLPRGYQFHVATGQIEGTRPQHLAGACEDLFYQMVRHLN